jgi:hypothetical protein
MTSAWRISMKWKGREDSREQTIHHFITFPPFFHKLHGHFFTKFCLINFVFGNCVRAGCRRCLRMNTLSSQRMIPSRHLAGNNSIIPPRLLCFLHLKTFLLQNELSVGITIIWFLVICSGLFLAWLIFDPEDGGDTFHRNVRPYTDYTALCLRRWQFS